MDYYYWIIGWWWLLDPLGNIYEIYGNLIVMTLLNFNHFWITQAELCLKGTFVKAEIHVCYHFLGSYENPRRKNFIKPSYPKHAKTTEIKNGINFYFHASLWCLKKVLWRPFWGTKKNCENKKIMSSPPDLGLGQKRLRLFLLNFQFMPFLFP